MEKKKRGLVIIYDPHSLQQFLWYYFTYAKDVEWDALCLPNGYKGAYMVDDCIKAGIFNKVYRGDVDYLEMDLAGKFFLFIQMVWYWITCRRIVFVRKVFNSYVKNIDNYDEIASICETGFVSGLSTLFSKTKKVSFFDDGLGEYMVRTKWSNHYKTSSFEYWQSFLLNKMGYGCKGRFYFQPTCDCYKYSAVTSEMKYRNYKEMLDMTTDNTDLDGYTSVLKNIYSELYDTDFDSVSAVVFTDDMHIFSNNYQQYYDKCTSYISDRHKSVMLKKHPKDFSIYNFNNDVCVVEIDNSIPAEVLLSFIKGKKIYFMMFSSIIIFMNQYKYDYDYEIFYSKQFYNENKQQGVAWKFHSREELVGYCERFSKGKYNIIDID